jgi:hypothetical protein
MRGLDIIAYFSECNVFGLCHAPLSNALITELPIVVRRSTE